MCTDILNALTDTTSTQAEMKWYGKHIFVGSGVTWFSLAMQLSRKEITGN